MRSKRGRPGVIMLWGLLATLMLTAGAFALAGDGSPDGGPPVDPGNPAPTTRVVSAELFRNFGVFRRPRAAWDAVPSIVARDPNLSADGANVAGARRVLSAGGDKIWAIPTATGACLTSRSGRTSNCSPLDQLLSGLSIASVTCAPSLPDSLVQISGMMRDGITRVETWKGATRLGVHAVVNNAYVLNLRKVGPLPTHLTWRDPDGKKHRVRSQLPPDAKSSCSGSPHRPAGPSQDGARYRD